MEERIARIIEGMEAVGDVRIKEALIEVDSIIEGTISVTELDVSLEFKIKIFSPYPFQFHDRETIIFYNTDLLEYSHVNRDGSICIHTLHNPDLKSKIYYDISSLKEWIRTYYISKDSDSHYSHIIVPESTSLPKKHCFLFTDVNYNFKKDDFGIMKYAPMSEGMQEEKNILTYLVQTFVCNNIQIECSWSTSYKKLAYHTGLYVFLDQPPVHFKRFVVESWDEIEPYISQKFLNFLDWAEKSGKFFKNKIEELPLLIGYRIPDGQIHWICTLISQRSFPNYAEKVEGKFIGRLAKQPIQWVQTKNTSHQYFFGRGALCKELTEKKILLIGLGAIGSIVATTLTRGGCKSIHLADYDVKEPENVCRSEYQFNTGLNNKTNDLSTILRRISPFIEVSAIPISIKSFSKDENEGIKRFLEQYDFIIDCTTDNDLAYTLDLLQLESAVINLSITNNAQELVCAVKPNLYRWLMDVYERIKTGKDDLYNPTGCWNPTFKASYNDINTVVQYALKHINLSLKTGKPLRSFYLSTDEKNEFTIKLNQF